MTAEPQTAAEPDVDRLRRYALANDSRNASCVADALLWLAAEVRELRTAMTGAAAPGPTPDREDGDDRARQGAHPDG